MSEPYFKTCIYSLGLWLSAFLDPPYLLELPLQLLPLSWAAPWQRDLLMSCRHLSQFTLGSFLCLPMCSPPCVWPLWIELCSTDTGSLLHGDSAPPHLIPFVLLDTAGLSPTGILPSQWLGTTRSLAGPAGMGSLLGAVSIMLGMNGTKLAF